MNTILSRLSVWDFADDLFPILIILGTVFTSLAIIWIIVSFVKMIRSGNEEKSAEELPIPTVSVTDSPDGATIAAISAAITAALQSEAQEKGTVYNGFRLVSFKRSDKGRSWTQQK